MVNPSALHGSHFLYCNEMSFKEYKYSQAVTIDNILSFKSHFPFK